MDSLNDRELDELLSGWQVPPVPASLRENIRRRQRWQWLLTGTIQVPVPLTVFVLVLFLAIVVYLTRNGAPRNLLRKPEQSVFQPVKRLEPRIFKSNYDDNNRSNHEKGN